MIILINYINMEEKFLSAWGEQKLDSNLKKELDDVKQIIMQTSMDFHNYVFPKYINNYKKYLWFVWERLSHIEAWQSNVNYPMISSAVDTMFSNIFDFGYQIWVSEEALKKQCTRAFDFRNTWKKVLEEVTKEALILWKWYAKDYLINEEFKDMFFNRVVKQNIKMPSMQYISAFDIMYDRSKWIDQSSYKIIRTFTSWENIKKKVLPLITSLYDKEKREYIKNAFQRNLERFKDSFWSRFSMYDYNPVKSLTATTQWMNSDNQNFYSIPLVTAKKWLLADYDAWWNSMWEDVKNYFLNANKSTYELVEYITSDRKYIFINWNIVYFGDKKYSLWEIREVTFNKIPWTWNANWISDKLSVLQDLQNTLWNAFIDNIKLNLWPMFKISWNIPLWKNWTLDFRAFKAYKTNGSQDIEKIQMWVTDFAPMNFMQMVEWTSLKESWMNNYVTGWGWSIERTQAWVDVKFNQYKSKLTPLTDSLDQMMWNITRSWIIMLLKFFTKEELLKMDIKVEEVFIKDKKWNDVFDTLTINSIDIKTIIDENNISFTYNSLDKITMENSRDTIMMNLQYMLQYVPGQLNMPELWKAIAWKTFNPEKILLPASEQKKPFYWKEPYDPNKYNNEESEEQPTEEADPNEDLSQDELLQELEQII